MVLCKEASEAGRVSGKVKGQKLKPGAAFSPGGPGLSPAGGARLGQTCSGVLLKGWEVLLLPLPALGKRSLEM